MYIVVANKKVAKASKVNSSNHNIYFFTLSKKIVRIIKK